MVGCAMGGLRCLGGKCFGIAAVIRITGTFGVFTARRCVDRRLLFGILERDEQDEQNRAVPSGCRLWRA